MISPDQRIFPVGGEVSLFTFCGPVHLYCYLQADNYRIDAEPIGELFFNFFIFEVDTFGLAERIGEGVHRILTPSQSDSSGRIGL